MIDYRKYGLVRMHSSAPETCRRRSFEEAAIVGFHPKSVRTSQEEGTLVTCFATHDPGNVRRQNSFVTLRIETGEEVCITARGPWYDAYKGKLVEPPALVQYAYLESQHLCSDSVSGSN
jgi:hypothetical protein